jgi:DeoR family transcriptional regulator, fructose operon transcriptional repressor
VYAEERRRVIAEQARVHGRVEVAALAEELAVTPETVRRDLTELERRGLLRRVHGGAIPADRFVGEPALGDKAGVMAAEKRRIAKAAVELVPSAGSVLLDAGTTTGELATLFPDHKLTVITNALPIATSLASRSELDVHLVGGRVRSRTLAAVDSWALRTLEDLRVDLAFVATNGLSVPRGLSTHDPAEAQVKAAMIDASSEVVLLADHTKFGTDQLVRYATLDEIDLVITDSGLDDEHADELAAAGPRVVRA